MRLTFEEKQMLEGKYGYPTQKAMEILIQLGEIYNAEEMLPVSNVHMPGSSVVVAGEAGTKFVEMMAEKGGKFRAFTTLNTAAVDFDLWKELGFPEATYKLQDRLTRAYEAMGGVACHTCTPYLIGNTPRFGENVAWGESSAIAFVNSVLGARTNRHGGPSALAAALTGRVPAYGYHLQENRYGHVLVNVTAELNGIEDYGSLGYWVGRIVESKVPVLTGIPKDASIDQLKMLGAALASSGSVALFHAVGITPEAPTVEAAFGGRQPEQVLEFGKDQLLEGHNSLNKHQGQEIKLVTIGCPHASISEIETIAKMLENKKLHNGVDLWVITAVPNKAYAERCGYKGIIEAAGGHLVSDTCPILSPMVYVAKERGYSAIATNSAKLAHYAPGQWALPTYYGSVERCINAALTGKF
ncbi:MAG TPA: aconitase X catalytic domain-containing protein [Clostridia bacterium]|nr:aconitase X catalytic domain-containing protein [Clostridia bacterium]